MLFCKIETCGVNINSDSLVLLTSSHCLFSWVYLKQIKGPFFFFFFFFCSILGHNSGMYHMSILTVNLSLSEIRSGVRALLWSSRGNGVGHMR